MTSKKLLTIFTPTFNRAAELKRTYDSLKHQTSSNFMWMIIDDGSADSTEEMVKNWITENKISIDFRKQKNKGKAKSMNEGIRLADTVLWMVLDSDDWLHEEAVQIIEEEYKEVIKNATVCGMIGLRYTPDNRPMQKTQIPAEYKQIHYHHLRYKLGIAPEYVEVFKTNILKSFQFPEIEGETYFPLSYLHDTLSRSYDFHVLREPIMYIEYQETGMTKKRTDLILKNPIGYMLFKKQLLECAPTLKVAIVSAVAYNSAAILAKMRAPVKTMKGKWLSWLTYPLGLADYVLRFKLKRTIHLEKTFE